MSVFVDTSALYAVLDLDDAMHGPAADAFTEVLGRERLVTHNYVVIETTALVQRRLAEGAVRTLLADLIPIMEINWIGAEVHAAATSAMLAVGKRSPSLVDWVSFEMMRRANIELAFAFDRDFIEQGFQVIPTQPGRR